LLLVQLSFALVQLNFAAKLSFGCKDSFSQCLTKTAEKRNKKLCTMSQCRGLLFEVRQLYLINTWRCPRVFNVGTGWRRFDSEFSISKF